MEWEDVPDLIDSRRDACAALAWDIKRASSGTYTDRPVGYYVQPDRGEIALHGAEVAAADLRRCKAAAARVVGPSCVRTDLLTEADVAGGDWVKVAFSPGLRRAGEMLNFFPGHYPGGIPNHPSPLAAMLTSGVLGAGLGYGTGRLAEAVLPGRWEKGKLRRTGAILGGLAGVSVPGVWALTNIANNKSVLDPWPLNSPPGSPPTVPWDDLVGQKKEVTAGDTMGDQMPLPRLPTPYDVNINALGQTLWETGATPSLAATTMGAMYAAQQLPDEDSRPGWVTGHQLGQLALNLGKDYLKGALVGAALNKVTGAPFTAHGVGMASAALGVISAVVPRLFGRG